VRVPHAQPRDFTVHQPGEFFLRPGHCLGERDGRVVARLHHHAMDQLLHHDGLAGLDEHARAARAPGALGHIDAVRERQAPVAQRAEHHVRSHELGERCRREALVGLFLGKYLAACQVGEQPGSAGDLRRGLCLGRNARNEQGQGKQEASHVKGSYCCASGAPPGTTCSI